MFDLKESLWAGYRSALEEAQRLETMCINGMQAGYHAREDEMAAELPRLYSRKDNVGVVTVRGPLINTENGLTAYFGISTYPAIREAFAFAAEDAQVDKIILDIESGGGQVSGVADTARMIGMVNKLKPVTAFTDGLAASAAYWLASSAGKVFAGETAIVGSIGVITTHVSYAEALKKEGVDVTVMRVGENKALGHPAEKLSEKAEAQIMGQMEAVYDIFTSHISARRSLPLGKRNDWANGNEFLGADAVKVGLVDAVSTADKVYAQLAVDKKNSLNNTQMQNNKRANVKTPTKATLNPALVAAAESGAATQEQLAELAAQREALAADTDSKTETAAAETPAGGAAAAADEAPAAAEAATPAADAAVEKTESEILAFLRSELKASQESVVALTVANKTLEAKVADQGEAFEALCDIARNGINNMAIGLGGAAADMKNLTGMELVAKHKAIAADFQKSFKVGGVAVTAPETEVSTPTASNVTPIEASRRKATGLK